MGNKTNSSKNFDILFKTNKFSVKHLSNFSVSFYSYSNEGTKF
jgi:hypothetical protein